ncbi:hypothetical protein EW146_g6055 [Bondarzewia mesenterica]|uniref:Uncharacterized protein n=1 Tax=Bondarzewia mesenterica TaxID=1095465 RepID=A0A4S4LRJ4_9AGAM|nr:hypothetical protein EW146_g6055 [Bondarzewia mesenterica]
MALQTRLNPMNASPPHPKVRVSLKLVDMHYHPYWSAPIAAPAPIAPSLLASLTPFFTGTQDRTTPGVVVALSAFNARHLADPYLDLMRAEGVAASLRAVSLTSTVTVSPPHGVLSAASASAIAGNLGSDLGCALYFAAAQAPLRDYIEENRRWPTLWGQVLSFRSCAAPSLSGSYWSSFVRSMLVWVYHIRDLSLRRTLHCILETSGWMGKPEMTFSAAMLTLGLVVTPHLFLPSEALIAGLASPGAGRLVLRARWILPSAVLRSIFIQRL